MATRVGLGVRWAKFMVLATAVWMVALPARADEVTWRATSVQGPRLPTMNTRIGVALFSNGEAATLERRISAAGPPAAGKMDVNVETTYRFADGSTIVMRSRETIHLSPQGTHGRDEWSGDGEVAGGSGRYAGIKGTFSFRAMMGLDGKADGMLGDSFLTGKASYTVTAGTR